MDKLKGLISDIEQINTTCEKIIRKSVPVMKSILEDKNNLVNQVKEKYPALDEKAIRQKIQASALALVSDAKTIKRETNPFISGLLCISSQDTPFLTEVWMGDTYGRSGADAFKDLLGDLNSRLENCTLENVIKNI